MVAIASSSTRKCGFPLTGLFICTFSLFSFFVLYHSSCHSSTSSSSMARAPAPVSLRWLMVHFGILYSSMNFSMVDSPIV